jgi:hypothetical protein
MGEQSVGNLKGVLDQIGRSARSSETVSVQSIMESIDRPSSPDPAW